MALSKKSRGFLAAIRIANLPGVASHTLTGGLVAMWLAAGNPDASTAVASMAIIAIAGVLLCLGGNLLNDWHDQAWDAKHRPERALPSGHFRPATFFALGVTSLVLAAAGAWFTGLGAGIVAIGIITCIAIYTRLHKRARWTVFPLALCRGLLPLLGAFALDPALPGTAAFWIVAAHGTALFLWTCGLSFDARGESTGGGVPSLLPWIPLAAAPWIVLPWVIVDAALPAILGLLPAVIWLAIVRGPLRHTAKQRVSALLAGLPLLDLAVLVPVVQLAAPGHPFVVMIPLAAFALGRILQRAASAT